MEAEQRGKKALALCILRVLERYAGKDAPMTTRQIIEAVRADYGLTAERKAVGRNLALLAEMGFDLSTYQQNGRGYYLRRLHGWDESEQRAQLVLCDALLRAPASACGARLLEKLEQPMPPVMRVPAAEPLDLAEVERADLMRRALASGRAVAFDYQQIDGRKTRVSAAVVSVAFDGMHYLMYAIAAGADTAVCYRLNRVSEPELTDIPAPAPRVTPAAAQTDLTRHAPEPCVLLCQSQVLDDLTDTFPGVVVAREGEYLRAPVCAPWPAVASFLGRHLMHATLLSPESRRREVRGQLAAAIACYPS